MPIDFMIPLGILCVIVIYLMVSRENFERYIRNEYEEKFDHWKHTTTEEKKAHYETKQLIGLVFKKGHRIEIELFEENHREEIEKKPPKVKTFHITRDQNNDS